MTDASVVLGYLNPARFAGGTLAARRGRGRARASAARRPAAGRGRRGRRRRHPSRGQRAHGRPDPPGHDQARLRSAAVLAGGRSAAPGPVHGAALAEEMGMAEVLVPEAPGVLAAFGLLAAAIEHDHVAHAAGAHRRGRPRRRQRVPRRARREPAARACARRACRAPAVRVAYAADMRYVGQAYELEVPIAGAGHRRRMPESWPRSTPCTSASTATPARSSRSSSSTSAPSTPFPCRAPR